MTKADQSSTVFYARKGSGRVGVKLLNLQESCLLYAAGIWLIWSCQPCSIGVLSGKSNERKSMADDQTQAPPPVQPPPSTPSMPPPGSPESRARTWNMLCHLSALAGFFIPFGNILGPLLVWQIKKNEIPSTDVHGKAALNFQITVVIALFVGAAVAVVL